jgi:NADH:ubiquinone oxidoreductase subunit K
MMAELIYERVHVYLILALFLLGLGILAMIYRRTLMGMLIGVELIMTGAGLNLVALNSLPGTENAYGQVFALFIMGLAAAEAAVALGIIILLFRRFGHIEGGKLTELKE